MLLNDMHTDWSNSDNDTRPSIVTLQTDGSGRWSRTAKPVQITSLEVPYIALAEDEEDRDHGELCVHFNTDSWRPDLDGLIYTDKLFLRMLHAYLDSIGLAGEDVSYSEQGMQGDNYVSCDVGENFIASWKAKYPEKYKAATEEN
jgi:hypothetical protein